MITPPRVAPSGLIGYQHMSCGPPVAQRGYMVQQHQGPGRFLCEGLLPPSPIPLTESAMTHESLPPLLPRHPTSPPPTHIMP